jgi:hypothetical protein
MFSSSMKIQLVDNQIRLEKSFSHSLKEMGTILSVSNAAILLE